MPKIAVLGWGSLISNPSGDSTLGQTALVLKGVWKPEGPALKIEYSRVSNGPRLTLVIDEINGKENTVFAAESGFTTLEEAVENLRSREKCKQDAIGSVAKADPAPTAGTGRVVWDWLQTGDFEGAVWTALGSNFREKTGSDFTLHSALTFLGSLGGSAREKAYRYFVETPASIATVLRAEARWPEAVAAHEAGHFVVGIALGRKVNRLSRVPVSDRAKDQPTTGCAFEHSKESHAVLVACDFAGPWAQLVLAPQSVSTKQFGGFMNGVLVPESDVECYSWTGWQHDMEPARKMRLADPARLALFGGLTPAQLSQLDQQVGQFLRGAGRAAIEIVAFELLAHDIVRGEALNELTLRVQNKLSGSAGGAAILAGMP